MAVWTIPTSPGVPHYRQESELDGTVYRLIFDWNAREAAWYMTLADTSGNPIRSGIRIVPNWPLLRKVVNDARPPGELMVVDARNLGITLANFGIDNELVYIDAEGVVEAYGG